MDVELVRRTKLRVSLLCFTILVIIFLNQIWHSDANDFPSLLVANATIGVLVCFFLVFFSLTQKFCCFSLRCYFGSRIFGQRIRKYIGKS